MAWIYLVAAGLFEIGWPVGLKWAQEPGKVIVGVLVAVVCMGVSGLLLFLAQKDIAIGTAYAVAVPASEFLRGSLARWRRPQQARLRGRRQSSL